MSLGQPRPGSILIEPARNGYILYALNGVGMEAEQMVAKNDDGGEDLVRVLKQLLVVRKLGGGD